MTDRSPAPRWFTIVAVLLVLWGLAGYFAFYLHVRYGAAAMGPPSDYDRAYFAKLPGWFAPVYGVATIGGLLGAAALLARSKAAVLLFAASLVAVVIQFVWTFHFTDLIAAKGHAATVPFPMLILAIAGVQLWLAWRARRRGWIA